MKSKSSQVICRSFIHSILDYSSTLLFFFSFFQDGKKQLLPGLQTAHFPLSIQLR